MSKRDNPVTVYLTDGEKSQLKEWSEEVEKPISQLARDAILEYTDRDRTARMEDRLGRIEDQLDTLTHSLENDTSHTHTDSTPMNQGSTASERARKIVRRLQSNHGEVMKGDVVDRAIEDIAGIDDRTLRKYKRLFRKRGLLFDHPGEMDLWTTDSDQWLDWMQSYAELNGREDTEAVVDDYPALVSATPSGFGIELQEEHQ